VDKTTYIERREVGRLRALRVASQLMSDEPAAAEELLSTWSFAADPDLVGLVLQTLRIKTPNPTASELAGALAAPELLPVTPFFKNPVAGHLYRRWLAENTTETLEASETNRLAWALDELAFLGEEVDRRDRQAWVTGVHRADAVRDAKTANLWAQWFAGNPWGIRQEWESLFLSATTRVFHAVCAARNLPLHVIERCRADLEDAFFFRLIGGSDEAAGWLELAARVLETMDPSPVTALASQLDSPGWDRICFCAATRGNWRHTAANLWPDLPLARTRAIALRQDVQAPRLEQLLDAHVALRLLESWHESSCGPRTNWDIVVQNRGRARARLRALVTESPGSLLDCFMNMEGIFSRTMAAVKRYAWAWAWQELALDFAFDVSRAVTPACHELHGSLPPLNATDQMAVRTWVLLVVIKGRLGHLQRWVRDGGTKDRDSTWARLLAQEMPESLHDPDDAGHRGRSYHRLRYDLMEALDDHLAALSPLLEQIAGLKPSRRLRADFDALVENRWDDRVPYPRSGFPTFLKNTHCALTTLNDTEHRHVAHND
jgi:hypothetical protein